MHDRDVRHRARSTTPASSSAIDAALRPAPGGHHPRSRPAPADLPAHRGLRPLRAAPRKGFTWERTDKVDDLKLGARALTLASRTAAPLARPATRRAAPSDAVGGQRPGRSIRRRWWSGCCPTSRPRQDVRLPRPAGPGRRRPRRHDGPRRPARPPGRRLGRPIGVEPPPGCAAPSPRSPGGGRRPTWSTWPSGRPGAGPAARPVLRTASPGTACGLPPPARRAAGRPRPGRRTAGGRGPRPPAGAVVRLPPGGRSPPPVVLAAAGAGPPRARARRPPAARLWPCACGGPGCRWR